jgi:hypothetical protein
MPILFTCPDCNKSVKVKDDLAGKRVRCPGCGTIQRVPEAASTAVAASRSANPPDATTGKASDRNRRLPRDEDDDGDEPERRRMSGAVLASLIAGGVVVLGGVIGLIVWLSTRDATPAPTTDQVVRKRDDEPKQDVRAEQDAPKRGPKPGNRERLPQDPPPQSDLAWTATPDALPAPVELPGGVQGAIDLADGQPIIFPGVPSAFVCVTPRGPRSTVLEVCDLRTMKKTGSVDTGGPLGQVALSADGAFLAGQGRPGGDTAVTVWSVSDGKQVGRITLNQRFARGIDLEFVGDGKLLTGAAESDASLYQVWDFRTAKELCQFKADAPIDRRKRSVSAGGKYLALSSHKNDRALLFDLTTGTLAGEAMLADKNFVGFSGLAFSPDGKSLAGLYDKAGASHFVVWDMATGKVKFDRRVAKNLKAVAALALNYEGPALEWLADSSAWFVYGSLLIDASGLALYWTVPAAATEPQQRRLFGTEYVARVAGDFQTKQLKMEKLPADQVAAALKGVHGGSGDETGGRPDVKAPDWSSGKKLPAPTGTTEWNAVIDPAAAAKRKLGVKPVALHGKSADFARVLFSGASAGQAVVLSASLVNELGTKRTIKSTDTTSPTASTSGPPTCSPSTRPPGTPTCRWTAI